MLKIELESTALRRALDSLAYSLKDMEPAMRGIATELLSQTEANFEDEGRPDWPTLADATVKQREKRGNWPGKMLQVSAGGLAGSVVTEYGPALALVGSNKKYAALQQFGGQAGRGRKVTVPGRPYLPLMTDGTLQPASEEPILDVVLAYLKKSAR
ncbi:phage virion morphogenesis protein [Crenobacter luteus]|uniref:phage virion morphogenesis protein n=1 Tax=Crenobacter luteus TaxID=1452487 RepID=UPI001046F47B|nr:phage virion morphogenesis protein [Crenobacter luteus]TCP09250.1 phage virion morphogenesis protein [Crenobacter luteus]